MMRAIHYLILVATITYFQFAGPAAAASFTFRTVADTASSDYSSLFAPSINDNGTVAFLAGLDEGDTGIFTVTNGITTAIADSKGPLIKGFFGYLSINNSGNVAFTASLHKDQYQDDYGLFVTDGRALTTVADSSNGDVQFFMPPSINDGGDVAFSAIVRGVGDAIYVHSGGQLTEVLPPDDSLIGGLAGFTPMNDAGRIAFVAQTSNGMTLFTIEPQNPNAEAVLILPPAPVVHGSNLGNAVGINDDGQILYLRGTGIFTVDESDNVSTIVDAADSEFSSLYPLPKIDENGAYILDQSPIPSINDLGSVAFFAVDEKNDEGIYVTNDAGTFLSVVRTGDALGGSTVVRLVLSAEGLNNLGKVAFFAELADGREGIFIASIVPEPTSVLLAIVALGLVSITKRRSESR